MNIWTQDWFLAILGALATGIATLITYGVGVLVAKLQARTKNEKAGHVLTNFERLVQQVVQEVNQTFVESLKKEGKFDVEAQREAFELASEKIKKLTTDKVIKVINELSNDNFEEYIKTQIENQVNLQK